MKSKTRRHAGGASVAAKIVAAMVLLVIAILAWNYWSGLAKPAAQEPAKATQLPTEEPQQAFQPTLPPAATATPAAIATATPTPAPRIVNVEIGDFYYRPGNVTVKAGDVVVWKNNGGALHTVTGREGQPDGFDSKWLGAGMEFNYSFSKPGTYVYLCSVHGGMLGTIVVEN